MANFNIKPDPSWRGSIFYEKNYTTGEEEISFSPEFVLTIPAEIVRSIREIYLNDRPAFEEWWSTFHFVSPAPVADLPAPDLTKKSRPHPGAAGFIYVLKSPHGFKIGRTVNLRSRLADYLGMKLPFTVEMVHTIPVENAIQAEAEIHARFATKRINGEWFGLSPEDVEYLKSL